MMSKFSVEVRGAEERLSNGYVNRIYEAFIKEADEYNKKHWFSKMRVPSKESIIESRKTIYAIGFGEAVIWLTERKKQLNETDPSIKTEEKKMSDDEITLGDIANVLSRYNTMVTNLVVRNQKMVDQMNEFEKIYSEEMVPLRNLLTILVERKEHREKNNE